MISRSKTSMMTSAAVQSALPTSPEVWSTFNCHQPTISCIGSLVILFFLTSLQNDCGLSFGWSWDKTKNIFKFDLSSIPPNILPSHGWNLFPILAYYCGFHWRWSFHYIMNSFLVHWMIERLLNDIVLHYVLWPTILPLSCSFITVISFFKSTTFLVLSSQPPFITFTLLYHHLLSLLYFHCSAHQNKMYNKVTCSHGSITWDTVLPTGLQ